MRTYRALKDCWLSHEGRLVRAGEVAQFKLPQARDTFGQPKFTPDGKPVLMRTEGVFEPLDDGEDEMYAPPVSQARPNDDGAPKPQTLAQMQEAAAAEKPSWQQVINQQGSKR